MEFESKALWGTGAASVHCEATYRLQLTKDEPSPWLPRTHLDSTANEEISLPCQHGFEFANAVRQATRVLSDAFQRRTEAMRAKGPIVRAALTGQVPHKT